ncbi:MAG: hypothetical protein ACRD2T_05075 [Thermoanaerobaculia bacterium]
MKPTSSRSKAALRLLALLAVALVSPANARAAETGGHAPVRYTATVVGPEVGSAPVAIHVDEFTTDEEFQRLAQVLAEKGSDGLRDLAFELDKGWVRIGNGLGYPIAVATRKPTAAGGEKVTIVVDRQIEFVELWRNLRSADYPFTYIELTVDGEGKGQGELTPVAKVKLGPGDRIQVEPLGGLPFRLLHVRRR